MKIAFVSSHQKLNSYLDDASFRYRCENLALALNEIGVSCKLEHIDSFKSNKDLTHAVFHRPKQSIRLKRLIQQLSKSGVTCIADFDDLVFDEKNADFSPAVLNNRLPRKKIIQQFKRHKAALNYFESVTVSTESLARQAKQSFPDKNIIILKNAMHHTWINNQHRERGAEQRDKIITYFPGTQSHNRDFLEVSSPLEYFLEKHSDTFLLVIGPLKSSLLEKGHKRIKHISRLPFADYMKAARKSWVNLLPLEPTPFNTCKSAIKVIEAGAFNAPTISSPLPDALRFDGIGASIALDENQWLENLKHLYNPVNYTKTTDNMTKHFVNASSPEYMATVFYNAFHSSSPITTLQD